MPKIRFYIDNTYGFDVHCDYFSSRSHMFVFQTYDKACTMVLKIKPTLNYAKPETDGAGQLINHVINNSLILRNSRSES